MALISSLARWPCWPSAARTALGCALVLLVSVEGVLLTGQATWPHLTVWSVGVLVALCAVPARRPPLAVRATLAAALSWTTTAIMVAGNEDLSVWGAGETLAVLILLVAVLRSCRPVTAGALGPALVGAAVLAPARDGHPGDFTLMAAVLTTAMTAFGLVLRMHDAQRCRDLTAARSAERIELARELHDLVAHHVAAIIVQAQVARYLAPAQPTASGPPQHPATANRAEPLQRALADIEDAGGHALSAMRQLVHLLRRPDSDSIPRAGLADITALVDAFNRAGPAARLRITSGVPEDLDAQLATTAHRVIREALTNVRKHAPHATEVSVTISTGPKGGLRVEVRNDGGPSAVPRRQGAGFGLVGLTERAQAMGGTLSAGPAPNQGWQVCAELPAPA